MDEPHIWLTDFDTLLDPEMRIDNVIMASNDWWEVWEDTHVALRDTRADSDEVDRGVDMTMEEIRWHA